MEDTFKTVTLENLESEHICCMIAEKKRGKLCGIQESVDAGKDC